MNRPMIDRMMPLFQKYFGRQDGRMREIAQELIDAALDPTKAAEFVTMPPYEDDSYETARYAMDDVPIAQVRRLAGYMTTGQFYAVWLPVESAVPDGSVELKTFRTEDEANAAVAAIKDAVR